MIAPPETRARRSSAFTLIEIMVVVGIIGLIAAMGIPTLYRLMHREGFGKVVSGVMELCSTARAQAILHGRTSEVIFYPREGRCELPGDAEKAAQKTGAPKGMEHAVTFGDQLSIEMLDVNLLEYRDAERVRVRFFPNGTSDEMTLILRSGSEWRKISLEITTGLPSMDSNPAHWR
jgi:prepilin-type N-terminal cleavage/methylation domain-containing protein